MSLIIEEFHHLPHVLPDATPTSDGVMSAADKAKLDTLTPGGGGAYTPAEPSQWQAPAPTTVDEALDRMAALLFAMTDSTPIP